MGPMRFTRMVQDGGYPLHDESLSSLPDAFSRRVCIVAPVYSRDGHLRCDRNHLLDALHERPFPRISPFFLPPHLSNYLVLQQFLAVAFETPKAFYG